MENVKESSDIRKFILGRNASWNKLQERAIPGGNSPKHTIPMDVDTPEKRRCLRERTRDDASSPKLRPQLESRRGPQPLGGRGKGATRIAARLQWETAGDKDEGVRESGLLNKSKSKQPLISSMLTQEKNDDLNLGEMS